MNKPNEKTNTEYLNQIINFLDQNSSFKYSFNEDQILIQQSEDQKNIKFNISQVEKVLFRSDFDGSQFIQINFHQDTKILITKNLIGFKPTQMIGFDSEKIPKVVTTVDLLSIVKAIENMYDQEDDVQNFTELEVLKRVFQSILIGAELVGFDMKAEKQWFSRNLLSQSAASA